MYLLVSAEEVPSPHINERCGVLRNTTHCFLGSDTMTSSRSAYTGSDCKLVVAIDVGTTYSGASYTFLKPGEVPRIYDVGGYVAQQVVAQLYAYFFFRCFRFKGQEDRQGNSKVPSALLYSSEGDLLACGAEISREESQDGIKTEWFGLRHTIYWSLT